MNKNKTIILLVIGILIVITLSIGLTYAFMKPNIVGNETNSNVSISACAKVQLKDNGSTINLENTFPMEEEMGLQKSPYEFTISSTCEEYMGFNLYLLTYSENQISDGLIRYGITSKNDTLLETNLITNEEANDITDEEKNEINQGVNKGYNKIYKIYSNNIPLKGESEYKLRIWIDENANNDTMNKKIKLGVIVKGYSRDETMAEYLIAHKDNTLIYHDGTILDDKGNIIDAEDLSYRYSGGNDVVNNYVCFGSESCVGTDDLYRIIGLFDDDQDGNYNLKIIKATYALTTQLGTSGAYSGTENKYKWNGDMKNSDLGERILNIWNESNLNIENLNGYYLNEYLKPINDGKWYNMIEEYTWIIAGNLIKNIRDQKVHESYNNEIKNPYTESNTLLKSIHAKVGLMYVSDYGYAAYKNAWETKILLKYNDEITKINNWMYMSNGFDEWTISRGAESWGMVHIVKKTGEIEHYTYDDVLYSNVVRPVMYLKSKVQFVSGSGTSEAPYIIFY